jgi:hypothetical protein
MWDRAETEAGVVHRIGRYYLATQKNGPDAGRTEAEQENSECSAQCASPGLLDQCHVGGAE